MKTLFFVVWLLALAAWAPRRAESAYCSETFGNIAADVRRTTGKEISCQEVEAANANLRLESPPAGGSWAFTGEANFRDSLELKKGIVVPADVLPLGTLERQAPAGPKVLIVFGLGMARRSDVLFRLAPLVDIAPPTELAPTIGDGTWYDRIGFFIDYGDGYPRTGVWKKFKKGGLWVRHQPKPEGVRECLPCTGWLCPKEPLACFSDFNMDGSEEIHLTDDCRGGLCGLAMFTPDAKAGVRLLFNALLPESSWQELPEGWALVPKPRCQGGTFCVKGGVSLGDPTCERPGVFLLRRGGARIDASPKLRDAIYPVSVRPLPKGCRMQDDEQLVWSPEKGFILYEK